MPAPPVDPPPAAVVVVARAAFAACSVNAVELLAIAAPPVEPPPVVDCTVVEARSVRVVEFEEVPELNADAVPLEELPLEPDPPAIPAPDPPNAV